MTTTGPSAAAGQRFPSRICSVTSLGSPPSASKRQEFAGKKEELPQFITEAGVKLNVRDKGADRVLRPETRPKLTNALAEYVKSRNERDADSTFPAKIVKNT
jgi:hypothetical protein